MSGVLAVDPGELRCAAAALRSMAAALEESSRTVSTTGDDGSWLGLAALEQAARRAETATMLNALAEPVRGVAEGLDRVALVAEDTGDRVRRHRLASDDLEQERCRLVATGPPAEPVAALQWGSRLDDLREHRARLESLVDQARAEFTEAQRALAARVERDLGSELYALLGTLALFHEAARRVRTGWGAARMQVTAAWAVHRLHRMRVAGGERTVHVVSSRLHDAARRLRGRPPGWVAKVPVAGRRVAAVGARGVPLLVLPDALPKVVDGGGYDGVRGGTTRVLAGAAVVGVVAAVAAPGVVTGGAVAVGAYQVWALGNWAYDNRRDLGRAAGRSWSAAKGGVARGWSAGRELRDRAAARARSGLDRLRQRWPVPSWPTMAGVLP